MAVWPICKIGTPVLRHRCADYTKHELGDPDLLKFAKDMVQTMRKARGVGLAANQVGVGRRLIVLECRSNPRYRDRDDFALEIFANAEIIHRSKAVEKDWEGCLSIPGYRGIVPRAKEIVVQAVTLQGKAIEKRFKGFHARVLQHEIDHINGFFYMDRMPDLKLWMHLEAFNRLFDQKVRDASDKKRS